MSHVYLHAWAFLNTRIAPDHPWPFATTDKSITIRTHETTREPSQVVLKSSIYWSVAIITLGLCLLISWTPPPSDTAPLKVTSHLDVEPNRFYYSANQFHIDLRGVNQLQMEVDLEDIQLSNYRQLIISQYGFDPQIQMSLRWIQDNLEQRLPLQNNTHSVNPIPWQSTTPPEALYLLIEINPQLGTVYQGNSQLTFNQMLLADQDPEASWLSHSKSWWSFVPLRFSAINSYSPQNQAHSGSLVLRIGLWVTLMAVLYCFMRIRKAHLISMLMLGWSLLWLSYLNNHLQQHQQIRTSFDPESDFINNADQTTRGLAERIESFLLTSTSSQNAAVVIVGPNQFNFLRLYKHLLHRNVALVDANSMVADQLKPDRSFVFIGSSLSFCLNPEYYPSVFDVRTITYLDADICIMQPQ